MSGGNARLRRGEEDRILAGHPWVYDNELEEASGEPGSIVRVHAHRGRLLGCAFYNPRSRIALRMLSRDDSALKPGFLAARIAAALARRRKRYDLSRESVRLAFGEADGLPGLVVDQYVPEGNGVPEGGGGACLSAQFLSAGMDARKEEIIDALSAELSPAAFVERDDASVRKLEGLEERVELLRGTLPEELVIAEAGLRLSVDLLLGQKTGYFLDQRENRLAFAALARGRRVLDAFCHTGGFGVRAAAAGAASVICLDSSAPALATARRNAELNGLAGKVETVEANAFDFLHEKDAAGERFGAISLDPPAFAKSRSAREAAYRGYKEINLRAMRLLEPGGVLATFSCSYHFPRADFEAMLEDAAADSGRTLRLLEWRGQPADHPVLLGYPESSYLKCAILEAE